MRTAILEFLALAPTAACSDAFVTNGAVHRAVTLPSDHRSHQSTGQGTGPVTLAA